MKKNTDKNKTAKLISSILIISIIVPSVFFSVPKKAEAVWWSTWLTDVWGGITSGTSAGTLTTTGATATSNATQLGIKIKEVAKEAWKETLKAVARRALQEMTKSTVNWINSGFHGAPLFLENPDSFFEDIAKSEVKTLVDQFGYDSLKFPFGKAFALNTINAYKTTLDNNTSYSLSKVINDPVTLRNYQTNFNVGGWNAFLINTQYPQNNYLGFQMVATEELSRRISGTGQNAVDKVQDALQQGQGFLSPQTCADDGGNNAYNTSAQANPWQRPSFNEAEWIRNNPRPENINELNTWTLALAKARTDWANNNTCKNLVNTTPGSVVSNQIMNAMGSGMRQSEYSAMVGNSMSAIFDALLSKFMTDGLNSLASKVNPKNDPDTWSYDGLTLGSPEDGGVNSTWYTGPEEPIYINKFIKAVDDGVVNTEAELQLMSQIGENLTQIWPKVRTLDVCIPGPDIGWEQRLEDEKNRADGRIQKGFSSGSDKQIDEGEKVKKELKFAVDFFKDWIVNTMIAELPSSILYLDEIKGTKESLSQQSSELIDARRIRTQGVARLKAIQSSLKGIIELDDENNAIQPEPGSFEEQILIQLKKQYDAARTSVTDKSTLEERQNELLMTEEKIEKLGTFATRCEEERVKKGWPNPAGLLINPEQAYFCDLPIIGGYTHGTFNGTSLTHPELPMVNAAKVLKYKITTIGSMLTFSKKTAYVNIKLSCSNIYNATVLDYKGTLPGSTNTNIYIPPKDDLGDGGPGTGICEFSGVNEVEVEEEVPQDYCEENGGSFTQNETP